MKSHFRVKCNTMSIFVKHVTDSETVLRTLYVKWEYTLIVTLYSPPSGMVLFFFVDRRKMENSEEHWENMQNSTQTGI